MKAIDNVVITARAVARFKRELERRETRSGEVIALHYMTSFTNADGTTVDGFAPGYVIDRVADRRFGDQWLMAQLPDGTAFRFMPKFDWRAGETYVVDLASAYTLSIGSAQAR